MGDSVGPSGEEDLLVLDSSSIESGDASIDDVGGFKRDFGPFLVEAFVGGGSRGGGGRRGIDGFRAEVGSDCAGEDCEESVEGNGNGGERERARGKGWGRRDGGEKGE